MLHVTWILGWLQIHCVIQFDLEILIFPATITPVLELKVCATVPLKKKYIIGYCQRGAQRFGKGHWCLPGSTASLFLSFLMLKNKPKIMSSSRCSQGVMSSCSEQCLGGIGTIDPVLACLSCFLGTFPVTNHGCLSSFCFPPCLLPILLFLRLTK